MKKNLFRKIHALELSKLLEDAKNDPILAPQLQDRLNEIQKEITDNPEVEDPFALPRTAIFFSNSGIEDMEGVRPILAGEALIQYEKMYIEQSLHDEREAAKEEGRKKRKKGTSRPELLFTGTPRGSFGLEFVPVLDNDKTIRDSRTNSLNTVTDSIYRVASAGEDLVDEVLATIPSPVLAPLKNFMKVIVKYEAELRLAYPQGKSAVFKTEQLKIAYEHLEREVTEEEKRIKGYFRGLTMHTGHFDILTEEDDVITGFIAEEMPEQDKQTLYIKKDQLMEFVVRITTIIKKTGHSEISYTLVRAK